MHAYRVACGHGWAGAGRGIRLVLAALAVGLLGRTGLALVEPIPDHEVRLYPTLVPKSGHQDIATNTYQPGVLRDQYQQIYEERWKQQSYYQMDSNTGHTAHGIYFKTKVEGFTIVPWPVGRLAASQTNGLPQWMLENPATFTDFNSPYELPYKNQPRAIAEPNWEVPPGEAGPSVKGQLFCGTNANPLLDGVWTPGEAFEDANANGEWDGTLMGEDRWWADNKEPVPFRTNWPYNVSDYHSTNSSSAWDPYRGEIYADYNPNTTEGSGGIVAVVGFEPSVQIWIQNPANPEANMLVAVSEFDFTPANGIPSQEGDFSHTYVSNQPGTQADVPRNGLFDYNVNPVDGKSLVWRAKDQDGAPLFLTYYVWISNGVPYQGSNATLDAATRTLQKVPVYQASEVFGEFYGQSGSERIYRDRRDAGTPGRWDPTRPGELFEDFLSWWEPTLGIDGGWTWLDVRDAPGYTYNPAATNRSDRSVIGRLTWDQYANYITSNYPGDVAGLLARTGNGLYDGPDNWCEKANNMYRWAGTVERTVAWAAPSPSQWNYYVLRGGSVVNLGPFANWWHEYFPLSSSPAVIPDLIPNLVLEDAGNTKTNIGGWIPPLGRTWSYDNAREFCDLPSSRFHTDGDGRLGEITSPWNHSLYGQHIASTYGDTDPMIDLAGPCAHGLVGIMGRDAGNVLSLEVATWRRPDLYRYAYGSKSNVSRNRDGNLNGMIDQGECRVGYPSYTIDQDPTTPNKGDGHYPFNYTRIIADVLNVWDTVTLGGLAPLGTILDFYHTIVMPPFVTDPEEGETLASQISVGGFQGHSGKSWSGVSQGGGRMAGLSQQVFWPGMRTLAHEQQHEYIGAPDFYDYEVWAGAGDPIINTPVGAFSIMGSGGMIHEVPFLKLANHWIANQPLTNYVQEYGGPQMLLVYPMEGYSSAYYYFDRNTNYYASNQYPTERLWVWYSDDSTPFSYGFGPGVYLFQQNDKAWGPQQIGDLFDGQMIQADGLNELQNGVNTGDRGDPFPGTTSNTCFSADTLPAARWYDNRDMGLRINDIVVPGQPGEPAEVTFERFDPRGTWPTPWWGADKDQDGIVDIWEYHWFGNLTAASATSDFDLDGLSDLDESRAGTDPKNGGRSMDYQSDTDGDGLINGEEGVYGTHPLVPDTDDDGILDSAELAKVGGVSSSPTYSTSPSVDRVLKLDGQAGSYVDMPGEQRRFRTLTNWTVMAWVKPTAQMAAGGQVVGRDIGANQWHFQLGVKNGLTPYVRFTVSTSTKQIEVTGPALALNTWTHLAGSFNGRSGQLSLYVNGVRANVLTTGVRPAYNLAECRQRVGPRFAGYIDEVGIFNQAVGASDLGLLMQGIAMQTDTNRLVAYYRFDDGTSAQYVSGVWRGTGSREDWTWGQVEDFAPGYEKGWMRMWRNGGTLIGRAEMIKGPSDLPVRLGEKDSDGDGLPDWWESATGLDPNDPTGINGAWGDPDEDGLHNLGEYQAGLDPFDPDTDGDGIGDFDERPSVYSRTYGEQYTDGDGMPDEWEGEVGLDPQTYDAQLDADGDGWSNYAEYQAGTDPLDPNSYPNPAVGGIIRYAGTQTNGITYILGYQTPTMDGVPTVMASAGSGAAGISASETIGHGDGVQKVFSGNLQHGQIVRGSVRVRRLHPTMVTPDFDFRDDANGNWRFFPSYTSSVDGNPYVTFNYTSGAYTFTWPTGSPNTWDAPWNNDQIFIDYQWQDISPDTFQVTGFKEGDAYLFAFRDLNRNNQWDPGEPCGVGEDQPYSVGWKAANGKIVIGMADTLTGYGRFTWPAVAHTNDYSVRILKISQAGAPEILNRLVRWPRNLFHEWDYQLKGLYGLSAGSYQWRMDAANGTFRVVYPRTVAKPQVVFPRGDKLYMADNELTWSMDPASTRYHLQVARQAANRSLAFVFNDYLPAPYRDKDGLYRDRFPNYAGEWGNGVYYWRVAGWNPQMESEWSDAQTFEINLSSTNSRSISGSIFYHGKAPASRIIVEAFRNEAFSGLPVARLVLTPPHTTKPLKCTYTLRGLNKEYVAVRAFLDVAPAMQPPFESRIMPWTTWAFVPMPANSYKPAMLNLVNNSSILQANIVLRDHDTDNDNLPDAWEMFYFGSLGQTGDMDFDGDGISNLDEYIRYGVSLNPSAWDSDGDGLSDLFEVRYTGSAASKAGGAPAGRVALDPTRRDTDRDGYSDGAELLRYGTDPLDANDWPAYRPPSFDPWPSPADYDGDGRSDAVIFDPQAGAWCLLTMSGQTETRTLSNPNAVPVAGDFDGDRRADFGTYDPLQGLWVLEGAGGQSRSVGFGGPTMTPVPADYNADGRTDLALYDTASGTWHLRTLNDGQTYAMRMGVRGMIPVPGDYNNDGAADYALYNPASGEWMISCLHQYDRVWQYFGGTFGGPGWVPVPGDYDGDGRADVCLYESATGRWRLLTWSQPLQQGVLGGPGWVPVPGDYDGDGRTDLALYETASGTWKVQCWSGAFYQGQFGWPGARPVLHP